MSDLPEHQSTDGPGRNVPARLRAWVDRIDPYVGLVAFVGGMGWDAATLVRIDRLRDNALLVSYLVCLAGLLVVEHRVAHDPDRWPRVASRKGVVTYAVHFLFGSLFSAYLVFYSKSLSMWRTLPWMLALFALMVVNEFWRDALARPLLRLALFWLCAFSLLLFFVPVTTGFVGPGLLYVCLVLCTMLTCVVGYAMRAATLRPDRTAGRAVGQDLRVWGAASVLLVVVDSLGWIPPVPLALMGGGIYHHVERDAGAYRLYYDPPPWYAPLRESDVAFRWREDEAAWCFTAIFAPTGLALDIQHVWEWWDSEAGEWVERDRIDVRVLGGREEGFRTYTRKRRLALGDWRVRVVSVGDRDVGHVVFRVVPDDASAPVRKVRVYR